MKLKTYLLIVTLSLLSYYNLVAQVAVPFTPRLAGGSVQIKGDVVLVGNGIVNKTNTNNDSDPNGPGTPIFSTPGDPSTTVTNLAALTALANTPYNGNNNNNGYNQEYIDVDTDGTTFSSSSANLAIANSCKKIVYAGLYWTAIYPYERSTNTGSNTQGTPRFNDWNQMKFKVPGGAYVDIIADNAADPVGDEDDIIFNGHPTSFTNSPYVCYKNVTSLLQALTNANGTYFGANIRAAKGFKSSGSAGGWSLVVIYESPTLSSRYISLFDGYAGIRQIGGVLTELDFNINGFKTLPPPFPVRATIGVSSQEGEKSLFGDNLQIKANTVAGFTNINNALNPLDNVFNSSITIPSILAPFSANVTTRVPNSRNTLGFDLDLLNIANPGNAVIPNNETGATIRLTSNSDTYGVYFSTFAVDVIEPNILLTKIVKDNTNVDITGGNVVLGQQLLYEIGFQNTGNDNATNFTIKDILPINVIFNPLTDVILPPTIPGVPPVTFTYTAGTRELIFTIPKEYVEVNDPRYIIGIKVQVVKNCYDLSTACSNLIKNQAFASYNGVLNAALFSDEGSIASFGACNLATPNSTNFLVGIDNCIFTQTQVLCGASVVLTAAPGYASYTWTGPGTITPVAGTNNQSVTVTQPGVYVVNGLTIATCKPITETITVVPFTGGAFANPILPYNENIPIATCTTDGVVLPYIFLCGATDSQLIATGITDPTITFKWEKSTCAETPNETCAYTVCGWGIVVGTSPNYTVTSGGRYRLTVTFQNGCFRTFYFNVYQTLLAPTATVKDIICTTPGEIVISNVPANYEYSIVSATGPWQSAPSNPTPNVFSIPTAGTYTVYIHEIGTGANACVFKVENLVVTKRDLTVTTIVTQPLCNGERGDIYLQTNNIPPVNITFSLSQGGTVVNSFGPQNTVDQLFQNLNPGTYTYLVSSPNGCSATGTLTIIQPPVLTATAAITKPLSCTDGEITITAVGGTGPYYYSLNSAYVPFQSTNVPFVVTTAGTYTFYVSDSNNCKTTVTTTIAAIPPPVFTIVPTNIICAGAGGGTITVNVTSTGGNSLLYILDNGTPQISNVFANVLAGPHTVVVQYTSGTSVCTSPPQTITITEPATPLTASGGVAAVACATNGGNAIVRITNPQGGTPYPAPNLYQYNFGSGYQNLNFANLAPGTYTISIQDANLCVYDMVVTVDPIPTPPTITVGTTSFNCNGTATATVTVNNNASSYAYTYLLDGVPNTPPTLNVFSNVTCGPRVITVKYDLTTPPTYSNLLNETFGSGLNTTSPGIAAAYCWNNQPFPLGQPCGNNPIAGFPSAGCPNNSSTIEDNQYDVTSSLNPNNCNWFNYKDHTSGGTDARGRFLAVNIGSAAGANGILYEKVINDILPTQPVIIDLYVANLLRAGVAGDDPDFLIQLVNGAGTVVSSSLVGVIDNVTDGWQFKTLSLNPMGNTTLTFRIRSGSIQYDGNDALLDDIKVYQLPVSCLTTRDFPILIPCNQAFTAQITGHSDVTCAGLNDGTITIAAQNFNTTNGFQYSINNGGTWITSLVSPVTFTVPAGYPGFVLVRYDATPANSTCSFNLPQVITTPAVLVANATAVQPTCLVGASITATAAGGTPAYQYQLSLSAPPNTVVVAFQGNPVFSNVAAGSYIVTVKDANGCSDPTNTPIVITDPVLPTATIATGSDLCYDTTNLATIVVTASGGLAPYQYSINGGAFQTSNTFPNLTPATYSVVVMDANGCKSTAVSQIIVPQITVNAVLTKGLDCTASPNAVITGTITGGVGPYTYQVSINAGAYGASVPVVGTTFTYAAATAGNYQFQVSSALTPPSLVACTATSGVITVNPLPLPVITSITQTQQILCNGDATAAINIVVNSALAYNITVINTTTGVNYGTQTTGLPAGNYLITVTNPATSCTVTGTINIAQPVIIAYTPVVNPITCAAGGVNTLGSICTGIVTGGTAPFTYTLTGVAPFVPLSVTNATGTNYCFPNIDFGTYVLTVQDNNGCIIKKTNLQMSSPPNDLSFIITPTIVSCTAGATISVTVVPAVAGGTYVFGILTQNTPPYATTFFPADAGTPLTHIFTGLTPGQPYTFVVQDIISGCFYFEKITTLPPTTSTLTSTVTPKNVTCKGSNDGSVSFTFNNYSATATGITYQIFNNLNVAVTALVTVPVAGPVTVQTVSNVGPLAPGDYYIQFTEVGGPIGGCGNPSVNFEIKESATLLAITASATNLNCNPTSALITAVAVNGTGPNTYQFLTGGSPVPTATSLGWIVGNTFTATATGPYDVHVLDAFGCIKSTSVTVVADPSPVISAVLNNQCTAAEGAFIIDVTLTTPGVPNYSVSLDNGPFQAQTFPYQITGLSSGSHTIEVKDKNGCGNKVTVVIVPPLGAAAVATALPSCANNDGVITVNTTGGSGVPYTYTILPNPAGITLVGNVFSNVPAGTYNITVVDPTTTCPKIAPVTLGTPTPVTFNPPTIVNTICNGSLDGGFTVNLVPTAVNVNDNPVYTYSITAGPVGFTVPTVPSTSNVFTGLGAGSYTVTVTSGRGCSNTQVIPVGEPLVITVPPPTITQFGCVAGTNTTNYAIIAVTGVTGGSSTYTIYQFIDSANNVLQTGPNNTYISPNLLGGTYTINVFDDKGCKGTITAIVNPFVAISNPVIAVNNPITCTTNENITVTVTTSGGTLVAGSLSYTVTGVAPVVYNVTNTTGAFTGLPIGDFLVTVTNTLTGCSVQTYHYVFDPNTFQLNTTTKDVVCLNDTNGSVDITIVDTALVPTNDAGPFSYNIYLATNLVTPVASGGPTPNAGPVTVGGLGVGTYTAVVTLTNATTCEVKTNFTINGPAAALTLDLKFTPITCVAGNNDGTITAIATGGWGSNYQYQLVGPVNVAYSNNNVFTGLTPGSYTVNVRDEKGCIVPQTIILSIPPPIAGTAVAVPNPLLCFGNSNATITVSGVTGGIGSSYQYTLNAVIPLPASGPQTSPIFPNLGAGTYTVTITDGYSCTFTTLPVVIAEPAPVVGSLVKSKDLTCLTQAELTLTATGGTGPYTYSVNGTTFLPATFNPSVVIPVPVGTYQYYIQDVNGCKSVVSNTIKIDPLTPLTIIVDSQDIAINCNGELTGYINTSAQGGLGNYSFTLLNGITNAVIAGPNTTGDFTGLGVGTYIVAVDSGDCREVTPIIIITEPLAPLTLAPPVVTNVTCNGFENGSITLVPSGGTPPYQYAITLNSVIHNTLQTVGTGLASYTFKDLPATTIGHNVRVSDANGCVVDYVFQITNPPSLVVILVPGSIVEETCAGELDAAFSISVVGGTTATVPPPPAPQVLTPVPYSYSLDSATGPYTLGTVGQTVFNFPVPPAGLAGGTHTVYIRDVNGCQEKVVVILKIPPTFDPTADVTYPCNGTTPTNVVTVNVNSTPSGLTATFVLDGGAPATAINSNTYNNLAAGPHTVIVGIDGCNKPVTFTIDTFAPLSLTVTQGGVLNQIVATPVGGLAPYTYTFNGVSTGTDNTYIYNYTGYYTVVVTDANGCTATAGDNFVFIDICIPNVFTPNGDGNNDGWTPGCTINYKDLITYIFDRYGRKIVKLKEGQYWDGKYDGLELPSGDYWYVIKVNGDEDKREFVGNFTLYR
jgi:large repetitive protein